jgi:propanol-preferring alcohol dehydrogenase
MNMLRRTVRALPVGLFGDELKLNLVTSPTRAYRLIGHTLEL